MRTLRRSSSVAFLLSVLCLLFLSERAWGALSIDGPTSVAAGKMVRLQAKGQDPKAALIWRLPEVNGEAIDAEESPDGRLLFTATPGKYTIRLLAIRLDAATGKTIAEAARVTVTIGEPPPPVPPVPPGPDPKPPIPPVPPVPPLPPAPIPDKGLRVLIVYETADLSKYDKGQQQIIYAKSVRDYLNSKCPVGADGKTKEWRMWDFDIAADGESKLWQDAFKRKPARDKLPWLIVSDGKSGYEGPLPATVADMLALLRKYGDK